MQYAVSDIHGCYDKYNRLLHCLDLSPSDTLVVEFRRLSPEAHQDVLDILENLTMYEEVKVGGREFVLVHAGLGDFSPGKALDDYVLDERILTHPDPGQTWSADRHLVFFGHTPTPCHTGARPEDARIFRKDKLVAIDCGCVSGRPLGRHGRYHKDIKGRNRYPMRIHAERRRSTVLTIYGPKRWEGSKKLPAFFAPKIR